MRDDRADIDAIKARHDIVAVAQRYNIKLVRKGRELWGLSPFKAERTASFSVNPQKQSWYCFASGQGGDVIALYACLERINVGEAIRRLKADLPDLSEAERDRAAAEQRQRMQRAEQEAAREKAHNHARAVDIWMGSLRAEGSLVETYLGHRGIDLDALQWAYGWRVPPSLRFRPELGYWAEGRVVHQGPAMVGALWPAPGVQPIRTCMNGAHRTWLAADGHGKAPLPGGLKAKLTLGAVRGMGGWLYWRSDEMIVGEGYETTLSVLGVLSKAGRQIGAVSAAALGNLAGAGKGDGAPHPVHEERRLPSVIPDPTSPGLLLPAHIKRVTILGDGDGKDPATTRALVERAVNKFKAQGKAVRVAWAEGGTDFNDMVAGGGARDVARAIEVAA